MNTTTAVKSNLTVLPRYQDQVTDLLDRHQIRYITIDHSRSHTADEISTSEFALNRELIEVSIVRIRENQYAMIVAPATRKINLDSLRKVLNEPKISFASTTEISSLFPNCDVTAIPPFGNLYGMEVFYIHELYALHDVTFCVQSHAHRMRMSFKDYLHVVQPHATIDVATNARYNGQIVSVNPESRRGKLTKSDTCILGFSLQSKNFSSTKLAGIAEWISKNFSHCIVLIGDSLHRITLEVKGMAPNRTLGRALAIGQHILHEETVFLEQYSEDCSFDVQLASEIFPQEECQAYYRDLCQLLVANEAFRTSARSFADVFVGKRLQQDPQNFDYYVDMSCTYLLEELAIFAYLANHGASVFVYPGALTLLQEIVEGHHPSAPAAFENLTSISLDLKRR